MSMNLSLRLGKERFNILYQTPSEVTRNVLASSDPFQVYADWVCAKKTVPWQQDDLEPDPIDTHLKHVEVLIAFTGARFVMV